MKSSKNLKGFHDSFVQYSQCPQDPASATLDPEIPIISLQSLDEWDKFDMINPSKT